MPKSKQFVISLLSVPIRSHFHLSCSGSVLSFPFVSLFVSIIRTFRKKNELLFSSSSFALLCFALIYVFKTILWRFCFLSLSLFRPLSYSVFFFRTHILFCFRSFVLFCFMNKLFLVCRVSCCVCVFVCCPFHSLAIFCRCIQRQM